jgi:aerobic-type carbon monoxide dehydrogenase small subunit (CoxS/CutS family)
MASTSKAAEQFDKDGDTTRLAVLRGAAGMISTRIGYGAALCGGCTAHPDGSAVRFSIVSSDSNQLKQPA